MHTSNVNESNYLLTKTTHPSWYLSINSLNDIIIDNSNDGQKQTNPNDSITSLRPVHCHIASIGHSTKLPEHTTLKSLPTIRETQQSDYIKNR